MPLWKVPWFLVFPFLYPLVSAPLMLPMMLAKPLQLGSVLVITIVRAVNLQAAIVLAVVLGLWYAYLEFTPNPRQPDEPKSVFAKLAAVVFFCGIVGVFLYAMETWTFNPLGRWFAAFGIAYYVSAVAQGFLIIPDAITFDRQLRRITKATEE